MEEKYEIYTDASFEDNAKIGTYSVVVKKEEKIVKTVSRKCRIKLKNAKECEIYGVYQALKIIEKLIKKNKKQEFLVKTDCLSAKNYFSENKKTKMFKENIKLSEDIKNTYKNLKNRLNNEDEIFKIKWISRNRNKIAHKYSYSVFKKIIVPLYNNNLALIDKKKIKEFLQKFDSTKCKVLIYLNLIKDEEKLIKKTQKEIAKALELPSSNINTIFKELIKLNMLTKMRKGKYKLLL